MRKQYKIMKYEKTVQNYENKKYFDFILDIENV